MTTSADSIAASASHTEFADASRPEQTRRVTPTSRGTSSGDGQRLFYELYGAAEETVLRSRPGRWFPPATKSNSPARLARLTARLAPSSS